MGYVDSVVTTETNPQLQQARRDAAANPDDISAQKKQIQAFYQARGGANQDFINQQMNNREQAMQADPARNQRALASQFEREMPTLSENAFNNVASQERRRLAGELSGIRSHASNRGLLFSGIRQGQEAGARGQSDVNLASAKQDINQSMGEALDKFKTAPLKTGISVADFESDLSNQAMARAIDNMQKRQSAFGSLGQAVGQGIGTYYGRQNYNNNGGY